MFRKISTYLLFPSLLVLLVFLYSFSVNRNSNKLVKKIKVEFERGDQNYLNYEMVERLLVQNGSSVIGQPKKMIDIYDLELFVSNNPFVEEATIHLTPRGLLKTVIKQRKAIARLVDDNGSFYIDRNQVKMPMSSNFSARVPLVANVVKDIDIGKIKKLLLFVEQDEFLVKEIVAIEKQSKDFFLTVRSGDYLVNLGDIVQLDIKFKKLKAFYSKVLRDDSAKIYKVINLKYHNQVVCLK